MPITTKQLKLLGWLAIVSAVIAIPNFVSAVLLAKTPGIGVKCTILMLDLTDTGLYVYIVLNFKQWLNSQFQFHEVDTYIFILVIGAIVLSLFNMLQFFVEFTGQTKMIMATFQLVIVVVLGIIGVIFGVKLLHLPDNLYGLLRPLSYLWIASSSCLVTVILAPLALIISVVECIILAMIFFRAAKSTMLTL